MPGCGSIFGYQHYGLALGPMTGGLLAEMTTGEPPFAGPAPFAVERFGRPFASNEAREAASPDQAACIVRSVAAILV